MNKKDFFYQYAGYLIVALIILPFLLFAENSKYSRFKNFIREYSQKQKVEEVEKVFTEEELKQQRQEAEEAEAGVVIDRIYNGRMFRVTFAEKPERSVINALKSAGYRWSKVCWVGDAEKLPPEVLKMSQAEAEKC